MLQNWLRGAAALAVAVTVVGCAEFRQRGGVVAELEDSVLFRANTKSHRLLRSYVIAGALITVARNASLSEVDTAGLGGNFVAALKIVKESYDCLYPDLENRKWTDSFSNYAPGACIFFDERMARLDYAIYKLAAAVMLDPESRQYFADVRDQLVGDIPVVGPTLKALTKTVEAANEVTTAAQQTTQLINNILRLSSHVGGRAAYLAPIYRDTLELDMRLVLHTLNGRCGVPVEELKKLPLDYSPPAIFNFEEPQDACQSLLYGLYIFQNGNGNLSDWRHFMKGLNVTSYLVEAYPIHFALVSQWITTACAAVFKDQQGIDQGCKPLVESDAPAKLAIIYTKGKSERVQASRSTPSRLAAPTSKEPPNLVATHGGALTAH